MPVPAQRPIDRMLWRIVANRGAFRLLVLQMVLVPFVVAPFISGSPISLCVYTASVAIACTAMVVMYRSRERWQAWHRWAHGEVSRINRTYPRSHG